MRNLYWLCLVAVVYGSLYPFNFVIPDIGDIDIAEVFSANSLGDAATNVLAFGLIGLLARLSAKEDQRQTRMLMVLAIALAVLAQFLQIFVPGRYPQRILKTDPLYETANLCISFRPQAWIATWSSRERRSSEV